MARTMGEGEQGRAGYGDGERGAMADDADVAWRDVIKDLRSGQVVQIPVADEADRRKKQQQLTRRAERHGFQIDVSAGAGVLEARRVGEVEPAERPRREPGEDREARRERRRAARGRGEAGGES